MLLSIATLLLFQFAPTVQAVPLAAAAAVKTASEPANLPAPADTSLNVTAVAKSASEPAAEATPANASSSAASSAQPGEAATVIAQNAEVLSTIRIPEESVEKPADFIGVEENPSREKWIALSLAQHGAAFLDSYTTRNAITHGAVEADPLMRPFASSSAIYAAIQVMPVALDFTARRMQRSPNNFIRRIWWVPQSVSTASFIFSGVHNIHIANER